MRMDMEGLHLISIRLPPHRPSHRKPYTNIPFLPQCHRLHEITCLLECIWGHSNHTTRLLAKDRCRALIIAPAIFLETLETNHNTPTRQQHNSPTKTRAYQRSHPPRTPLVTAKIITHRANRSPHNQIYLIPNAARIPNPTHFVPSSINNIHTFPVPWSLMAA